MAKHFEQMEVEALLRSGEGGAILATGSGGSRCLSTSFGAAAAIESMLEVADLQRCLLRFRRSSLLNEDVRQREGLHLERLGNP